MKLNIADHLPDAWFDFLGRLLPGVVVISLALIYLERTSAKILYENIGAFLILGYLIGHFLQPLGSFFARKAEEALLIDMPKVDIKVYRRLVDITHPLPRNILLAEKAYAEAVSFFSSFVACGAFVVYYWREPLDYWGWVWVLWSLSLFLGFERVFARLRKIERVLAHTIQVSEA